MLITHPLSAPCWLQLANTVTIQHGQDLIDSVLADPPDGVDAR